MSYFITAVISFAAGLVPLPAVDPQGKWRVFYASRSPLMPTMIDGGVGIETPTGFQR